MRSRLERGDVTEPALASPRWRVSYPGRRDRHSTLGVASPSWHTFDRRVWRRDLGGGAWLELELTNLRNEEGVRAAGKIATYRVVLRRGLVEQAREEGHDWQALVRGMKLKAEGL